MAASGLLRERDLRVLTAVIQDGLRDDPGEAMPWVALERLQQLIPSDTVALADHDVARSVLLREQGVNDGGGSGIYRGDDGDNEEDDPRFWKLRNEFLPNMYSAPGGDLVSALRWSDFYTLSEMRNTPFFAEYLTPGVEFKYHLFVPLPAGPGQTRRVGFWRTNRDYSERDRLALQLLRPHLHEVYLDAERRRRGIPHLSRREKEVLQLASQGYSNADIARILFISPATVAKHMEHIFDRTGVRTRSAAAALALPPASFRATPVSRRSDT